MQAALLGGPPDGAIERLPFVISYREGRSGSDIALALVPTTDSATRTPVANGPPAPQENHLPSSRKHRTRPEPGAAKGRLRRGPPKVCLLCKNRVEHVDYKEIHLLNRFMSERGKIKSRSSTGTCKQHQSAVAIAIKNAREMALLPYAVRTLAADRGGGRGRRGAGAGRPSDRPGRPAPGRESAPAAAQGNGSDAGAPADAASDALTTAAPDAGADAVGVPADSGAAPDAGT